MSADFGALPRERAQTGSGRTQSPAGPHGWLTPVALGDFLGRCVTRHKSMTPAKASRRDAPRALWELVRDGQPTTLANHISATDRRL